MVSTRRRGAERFPGTPPSAARLDTPAPHAGGTPPSASGTPSTSPSSTRFQFAPNFASLDLFPPFQIRGFPDGVVRADRPRCAAVDGVLPWDLLFEVLLRLPPPRRLPLTYDPLLRVVFASLSERATASALSSGAAEHLMRRCPMAHLAWSAFGQAVTTGQSPDCSVSWGEISNFGLYLEDMDNSITETARRSPSSDMNGHWRSTEFPPVCFIDNCTNGVVFNWVAYFLPGRSSIPFF